MGARERLNQQMQIIRKLPTIVSASCRKLYQAMPMTNQRMIFHNGVIHVLLYYDVRGPTPPELLQSFLIAVHPWIYRQVTSSQPHLDAS